MSGTSWSLPDSLPQPGSDLSWWDSKVFSELDQNKEVSLLNDMLKEPDSQMEWWDHSLFDESEQAVPTEPTELKSNQEHESTEKLWWDDSFEAALEAIDQQTQQQVTPLRKEAQALTPSIETTPSVEKATAPVEPTAEWWDDSFDSSNMEAALNHSSENGNLKRTLLFQFFLIF